MPIAPDSNESLTAILATATYQDGILRRSGCIQSIWASTRWSARPLRWAWR